MAGDLVANFAVDSNEFLREMKKAQAVTDYLRDSLARTPNPRTMATDRLPDGGRTPPSASGWSRGGSGGSPGRGGGSSAALNNVAYMIDDFGSQIQTAGLGPAIRATSNNMQMLAAAGGPVAMMLTTVGMAIASSVLPKLLNFEEGLKANKKALDDWATSSDRAADSTRRELSFKHNAENIGSMDEFDKTQKTSKQTLDQEKARLAGTEAEMSRLKDEKWRLEVKLQDRSGLGYAGESMSSVFSANAFKDDNKLAAMKEQYEKLEKEATKARLAIADTQSQIDANTARKPEIQKADDRKKADDEKKKADAEAKQAAETQKRKDEVAAEKAERDKQSAAEQQRSKMMSIEETINRSAHGRLDTETQIRREMEEQLKVLSESQSVLSSSEYADMGGKIVDEADARLAAERKRKAAQGNGPTTMEAGSQDAATRLANVLNGNGGNPINKVADNTAKSLLEHKKQTTILSKLAKPGAPAQRLVAGSLK